VTPVVTTKVVSVVCVVSVVRLGDVDGLVDGVRDVDGVRFMDGDEVLAVAMLVDPKGDGDGKGKRKELGLEGFREKGSSEQLLDHLLLASFGGIEEEASHHESHQKKAQAFGHHCGD